MEGNRTLVIAPETLFPLQLHYSRGIIHFSGVLLQPISSIPPHLLRVPLAPTKNVAAHLRESVSAPETLSPPALDANPRAAILIQSLWFHHYSRDSIGNNEPFDAAVRTEGLAAWSNQDSRLIHGSGLMEVKIERGSAHIRGDVASRAAGR